MKMSIFCICTSGFFLESQLWWWFPLTSTKLFLKLAEAETAPLTAPPPGFFTYYAVLVPAAPPEADETSPLD